VPGAPAARALVERVADVLRAVQSAGYRDAIVDVGRARLHEPDLGFLVPDIAAALRRPSP